METPLESDSSEPSVGCFQTQGLSKVITVAHIQSSFKMIALVLMTVALQVVTFDIKTAVLAGDAGGPVFKEENSSLIESVVLRVLCH